MLWLLTFVSALALAPAARALNFTDYANDFPDPAYVLAKGFSASTAAAQQTIVGWADSLAVQGPWCELSPLTASVRVALISGYGQPS